MSVYFKTPLFFIHLDQKEPSFTQKTLDFFNCLFTFDSTFQAAQINLKNKTITLVTQTQTTAQKGWKIASYFLILPLIIALAIKIILHCLYASYKVNPSNPEKPFPSNEKKDVAEIPPVETATPDPAPALPAPRSPPPIIPIIPNPPATITVTSMADDFFLTPSVEPTPTAPLPAPALPTPVFPLTIEPSNQGDQAQTTVTTFEEVVTLPPPVVPYYKSRISFSNHVLRNCGPNSFAVVLAHTGYSLEKIHKQTLEIPFESAELLERELKSSIEEEAELMKKYKNLEKGTWLIERYVRDNLANDQYAKNPDLGITPEMITEKPSEERTRAREKYLKNNRSEMEANKNGRNKLITNMTLLEKRIKIQKDRSKLIENIKRADKTLRILRGEEPVPASGYIDQEEANALCKVYEAQYNGEGSVEAPFANKERNFVYNRPERCREDAGAIKLKNLLYHSDWRVIRVGRTGNPGHWFTYIRNEGEESATLLDDWSSSNKSLSFKQIFDLWSIPETWEDEQIAFYSAT